MDLQIRLEQAWSPGCLEDVECVLCDETFRLGVVIARLVEEEVMDRGAVCPECALHLAAGPMGHARPEAFPGLEEFAARLQEWQTTRYATDAEFDADSEAFGGGASGEE